MKNPFTQLFRARNKPGATDSVSSASTFYFGSSAAGKSVTASTAIQMSTVYACVRVIAETIASLTLDVYQDQGEGSAKAMYHPLYPVLHDEPQQRDDLLCVAGNAACASAAVGQRLLSDHPQQSEPDSRTLSAAAGSYGSGPRQCGYADLYLFHRQRVNLRPEDVLHIPGLGFDRIMGYSPIVHERMPSVWDSPPKNLNKLGSTYARDVVCAALPISCRLASSSCPCPALPYLWPVSRQ